MIGLDRRRRRLELSSRDNGAASTRRSAVPDGHQGLANMRARAADLGGGFEVTSEPGAGTDIIVRVPLAGRGVTDARTGPEGGPRERRAPQ